MGSYLDNYLGQSVTYLGQHDTTGYRQTAVQARNFGIRVHGCLIGDAAEKLPVVYEIGVAICPHIPRGIGTGLDGIKEDGAIGFCQCVLRVSERSVLQSLDMFHQGPVARSR